MATRKRKIETPEETRDRWLAGQVKGVGLDYVLDHGWEAGQVEHITTADGTHYERFDMDGGGYVVIEWDDDGNTSVGA